MTIVSSTRLVTGGVDTHLDVHVAAVVDANGGVLGVESFADDTDRARSRLVALAGVVRCCRAGRGRGHRRLWGGAGASSRSLRAGGDRGRSTESAGASTQRQERPVGCDRGRPWSVVGSRRRTREGRHRQRRSVASVAGRPSVRHVRCGSAPSCGLRHLMFTAPDELRQRLATLSVKALVNETARQHPRSDGDPVVHATETAAVTLARRIQGFDAELELLDAPDRTVGESDRSGVTRHLRLRVRHRRHTCSPRPATTPHGSVPKRPGPSSAGSLRSRPCPARATAASDSTGAATARPTTPVADRADPPRPTRTAHRRLHEPAPRRRQVEAGDLPLPQALRRPRDLSSTAALTTKSRGGTDPRMP